MGWTPGESRPHADQGAGLHRLKAKGLWGSGLERRVSFSVFYLS